MKKGQMKNSKRTTAERESAIDKKKQKVREKTPIAAKRTIKQVVIDVFAANPTIKNDDLIAAVKKEFPASAFNEKHASWYRWQAKKGALTGIPSAISPK